MKKLFPIFILLFIVAVFFRPFFLQGKLPIPSDTIVGLYHPFRDLYAKEYPRGVPFKNFLITDPVRQQYPWKLLAIENEKKGGLPLWNPYTMAGGPLLGSMQSGALYPLNVVLLFLPFSLGWSLFIFAQQAFAAAFLYLYLNNLKLKRFASFLGALTYAFCGFFIAWLEWGTVAHVALWLPLVLLAIDKISHSNSHKSFLVWGGVFLFSLASAFLAGHLQTFFYLFLVSLCYFFVRWWQMGRQKSTFFIFLILNVLFLLVTFVQWFSTLQLILQSARDVDQVWQKEGWFIPWQHLIQFVAPDFFGNPTTLNYWGEWNYAEFVGYVGIVPLIMALFALFSRRDKNTFLFGMFFIVSLVFALPNLLAKIPYVLQIPFLATAQPTRLMFLVDFSLAVLAALGLDFFLRQKNKKEIIYPLFIVGIIFVSLWLFVLIGYKSFGNVFIDNIAIAKRNLYFPTLIWSVSFLILVLSIFLKKKKIQLAFLCVLFALLSFDFLRFSEKFTPFTDKAFLFPQTKALAFLQEDQSIFRIMATDSQIMVPNFSTIYKLQTVDGYDPLYLRRYGELIAAIERGKPDINPPFGFNRIITPHNSESRLVDLLGVKYILSLHEITSPKYEKVYIEGQTKIYKNKDVFPRAFFVKNIKQATNKQEAMNHLFDKEVDLKTTAIVEGAANMLVDKTFSSGSAVIRSYSENEVVIETNTHNTAYLVLMDTYYPTWRVNVCSEFGVECRETKIYQTNYNFRGVIVPSGKHTILFYISLL